MKKIISTLFMGLACSLSTQAQDYNLFADVDDDGWLWFDTQDKIDKYVGLCNEEGNKVDPKGKIIQMVPADIMPDYPSTIADPLWDGAGEGGEIGAAGSRTGAIILAKSASLTATNGGGFVVLMPSCSTYSICLSAETQVYMRMMGSTDINTVFTEYTNINAHSLFNPLCGAGIYTWTGIENLDNGNIGALKLKGNTPVYAYFQNNRNQYVYIHGIRVTTPTNTVGIRENKSSKQHIFFEGNTVVLHETADILVCGIDGKIVTSATTNRMDLSNLPKGLYVIKAGDATRKLAIR